MHQYLILLLLTGFQNTRMMALNSLGYQYEKMFLVVTIHIKSLYKKIIHQKMDIWSNAYVSIKILAN